MNAIKGNVKTGCGHPVSAAYRELAVRSALRRMAGTLQNMCVLDYFGGDRNAIKYANVQGLDFISAPDWQIQGDSARGFHRVPLRGHYHSFLMQDVYQTGDDAESDVSPEILVKLCTNSVSGSGYILTRCFEGWAGQDSELYDEGMWIRDEHTGLIQFSPDPTGVSYALHPDMTWLFRNRSYRGLDIADIGQFGPYKLFCVSPTPPQAQPLHFQPLVVGVRQVQRLDMMPDLGYIGNLWRQFKGFFDFSSDNERYALVDMTIYTSKSHLFKYKALTPQLRDSAVSSVNSVLLSLQFYERMRQRFPMFYSKIAAGTIRAVLYHGRAGALREAVFDITETRDLNEQLLEARAGRVQESIPWLSLVPIVCVLLYGVYRARRLQLSLPSTLCATLDQCSAAVRDKWNALPPLTSDPIYKAVDQNVRAVTAKMIADNPQANSRDVVNGYLGLVVFTPLFEETMRTFFPRLAGFLLCFLEPFMKLSCGAYAGASVSAVFHTMLSASVPRGDASSIAHLRSWLHRVAFHMLWNLLASAMPLQAGSMLSVLWAMQADKIVPVLMGASWDAESGHVVDSPIRPEVEETLKISYNGEPVTRQYLASQLEEYSHTNYVEKNKVFPILTPVEATDERREHATLLDTGYRYLFCRPSCSPINLYNALHHRTWKPPFPLALTVYEKVWSALNLDCRAFFLSGHYVSEDMTLQEALANMDPPKRYRLLCALETCVKNGSRELVSLSISVKHNEVIARKDLPLGVKPRAIAQLEPEYLVNTTIVNHQMKDLLTSVCSPTEVRYITHVTGVQIPVCFVMASGFNSADLNALFARFAIPDAINYYVVAGDDMYLRYGSNPLRLTGGAEGDFTQYDHSQCRASLFSDQHDLMEVGFSQEQAELEVRAVQIPYVVKNFTKDMRLTISFETDPQQGSGRGSTTWGNGWRNIKAGYYYFEHMGLDTMQALYAKLGFTIKIKTSEDLHDLTFLKGWWVPTSCGGHWLPLPSIVLKLAKLLVHPGTLFPDDTEDVAYRKSLFALSRSPGALPSEYPIVGPFVQVMERFAIQTDVELAHKKMRIRVDPMHGAMDVEAVRAMICARYDLQAGDIDDFSSFCSRIATFPVLLVHPVFSALMVDYA